MDSVEQIAEVMDQFNLGQNGGLTARNLLEQLEVFGFTNQSDREVMTEKSGDDSISGSTSSMPYIETKLYASDLESHPFSEGEVRNKRKRDIATNSIKLRHYEVKRGLSLNSKHLFITFAIEMDSAMVAPPSSPMKNLIEARHRLPESISYN